MLHSSGSVLILSASNHLGGSATTWKSSGIKPGMVFQPDGGNQYLITDVFSDYQIKLNRPFAEPTYFGTYTIFSDFSRGYNLPFPSPRDVERAVLLGRTVSTIDRELRSLSVRVTALETAAGDLRLVGVASGEMIGYPGVMRVAHVSPSGAVSAEMFGATSVYGGAALNTTGIVSGEAFGLCGVGEVDTNAFSIPSGEVLGAPTMTWMVLGDSNSVTGDSNKVTGDGLYTP